MLGACHEDTGEPWKDCEQTRGSVQGEEELHPSCGEERRGQELGEREHRRDLANSGCQGEKAGGMPPGSPWARGWMRKPSAAWDPGEGQAAAGALITPAWGRRGQPLSVGPQGHPGSLEMGLRLTRSGSEPRVREWSA